MTKAPECFPKHLRKVALTVDLIVMTDEGMNHFRDHIRPFGQRWKKHTQYIERWRRRASKEGRPFCLASDHTINGKPIPAHYEDPVCNLIPDTRSYPTVDLSRVDTAERETERLYVMLTSVHDNVLSSRPPIATEDIWPEMLSQQIWSLMNPFYGDKEDLLKIALQTVQVELANRQEPESGPTFGFRRLPTKEKVLQYVFKTEGATWRIIYGEHETTVDDSRGVQYIHCLMKSPNKPIECLDIERACSDAVARDVKIVDSEEALDADLHAGTFNLKQLEDYDVTTIQRAKSKLETEWESETDPSRKAELKEQIRDFDEYLGKNLDIHGKGRPVDEREKSRWRVSKAINGAKQIITSMNEKIGAHFQDAVKASDKAFVYQPDRELTWVLE